MTDFDIDSEEIRNIILNAHKIKEHNKCPDCNGTGIQNWDEDGGDLKPGMPSPNSDNRDWGDCENCDGIGYYDILMYD